MMGDPVINFMQKKWQKELPKNIPLGGTVKIQYADTDFMVGAPLAHIHQGIELLQAQNRQQRRNTMANVNRSIRQMLPVVGERHASQKQAIDLARDITIWFANEVIEGRKTMDNLEFLT